MVAISDERSLSILSKVMVDTESTPLRDALPRSAETGHRLQSRVGCVVVRSCTAVGSSSITVCVHAAGARVGARVGRRGIDEKAQSGMFLDIRLIILAVGLCRSTDHHVNSHKKCSTDSH